MDFRNANIKGHLQFYCPKNSLTVTNTSFSLVPEYKFTSVVTLLKYPFSCPGIQDHSGVKAELFTLIIWFIFNWCWFVCLFLKKGCVWISLCLDITLKFFEYYFSSLYLNCVIGLNLFIFSDWMINILQVATASARIMFCFVLSFHLICLIGWNPNLLRWITLESLIGIRTPLTLENVIHYWFWRSFYKTQEARDSSY